MDENTQFYTIILRHDDSTNWMINNPILALGEYGVEDDTHRVKRGDGQTLWSELSYEEFGLQYMITYKNLSGEVADNEKLQKALDKKLNVDTFENVGNTLTSSIKVTSGEKEIAQITRIGINVSNKLLEKNIVLIQSDDHSLTGAWSLSDDGVKTLNLRAQSAIDDYEKDHNYYKDQICFYNNVLYRAIKDFTSTAEFNEKDWVKLASLHSDDIKYDNKISGLESRTVKEALDELKDLDNEKLQKTRRSFKIYGTNEDGEQTLYDKDSLRTVDTVNGVPANETSKNIQIDASNINYNDNAEEKKTIKEILDSKVNNTVLGEDSVVTNIESNYNEQTGEISFNIAKKQLDDGTESTEQLLLNVVSETELNNAITNNIYDIVSTDNTLVSKPVLDESGNLIGIDLSTNLDIDVNYFITSETLKTDIPSENVVRLDSLTATDKTEVEVQDIISDSEGTWSRVKSIDKQDGTCVTVTYAKHAQAVWGTVKGEISNQTDLNNLIDNSLKAKLNTNIFSGFGGRTESGYDNIISMYDINLYTGATNKIGGLNFYSQITDGTMFSLDTDEESNTRIKLSILPEYLTINTQETGLTNTKLSPIIRELKTDLTSLENQVSPLPRTVNSIEPTRGNILITPDNMKLTDFLSAGYIREIRSNLRKNQDDFNTVTDLIRGLTTTMIGSVGWGLDTVSARVIVRRLDGSSDLQILTLGGIDSTDPLILHDQGNYRFKAEILGEYVKFDAKDSNLTSTEVGPAIRELKSTIDNKPGVSKYTKGNTYKEGDLVYLQKEGDTTCYLSVVIADFTADNTESNNVYQSFEADMTSGYMLRVSIPNEA